VVEHGCRKASPIEASRSYDFLQVMVIVSRSVIRALLVMSLANSAAGEDASLEPLQRLAATLAVVEPASPTLSEEARREKLQADLADKQRWLRLGAMLETIAVVGCVGGIAARSSSMWVRSCGAAVPLGAGLIFTYSEIRRIKHRLQKR